MSIFPKRTLPGKPVTIHWNFNTSKLKEKHIFPLVRIGVKDPLGNVKMLFEEHVLALPAVEDEKLAAENNKLLYLNKNLPILLLASYLSGKSSKEKLADILQNIQGGRHFYFTYQTPENTPLGKYTLVSEVISEGEIRYSKTAIDDFFYVEKVSCEDVRWDGISGKAIVKNHSLEPAPVKIIDYTLGEALLADKLQVFELEANETKEVLFKSEHAFLSYNEEREMIPLSAAKTFVTKSPWFLSIEKPEQKATYLLNRQNDEAYLLDGETNTLWQKADGIHPADSLRACKESLYDEMLANKLLVEIVKENDH
ncbi:hypothetical protein [Desertivirga brevis]|uniref:hypothetical protein n=1 Tax=Desertivirga brevis TaxID=2810310 RepID=UPI001A96ABFC|nr:hypothetical protein [Pedobacter sp. SYSU D00873]